MQGQDGSETLPCPLSHINTAIWEFGHFIHKTNTPVGWDGRRRHCCYVFNQRWRKTWAIMTPTLRKMSILFFSFLFLRWHALVKSDKQETTTQRGKTENNTSSQVHWIDHHVWVQTTHMSTMTNMGSQMCRLLFFWNVKLLIREIETDHSTDLSTPYISTFKQSILRKWLINDWKRQLHANVHSFIYCFYPFFSIHGYRGQNLSICKKATRQVYRYVNN